MAINRIKKNTDAENLVGRYVMKLSSTLVAEISDVARVTGAMGNTCELESVLRWWNDEAETWVYGQNEDALMQPGGERIPSVQVLALYLACDTIDELNSLREICNRNMAEFNALLKRSRQELEGMADGTVPAVARRSHP